MRDFEIQIQRSIKLIQSLDWVGCAKWLTALFHIWDPDNYRGQSKVLFGGRNIGKAWFEMKAVE